MSRLYQFKVHNASNLPKADTLGSIDSFFVFILSSGQVKTPVVKNSYNPRFNYKLAGVGAIDQSIAVQVYDHDVGKKPEMVGSFNINPREMPFHNRVFEIDLVSSFANKRKDKGHGSSVVISAGSFPTYEDLKQKIAHTPRASSTKFNDSNRTITVPLSSGFNNQYNVELKYDTNSKIDIYVRVASEKEGSSYKFGLSFGGQVSNKYVLKHHTSIVKNSEYWKLDDLPLYTPFETLSIWEAESESVSQINGDSLTENHGWRGILSYDQAKKSLKRVICDDKGQSIYFEEPDFLWKYDWDSSNFDVSMYVLQSSAMQGKDADMYWSHRTNKGECTRTVQVYGHAKQILGKSVISRVSIDDVKYGVLNEAFKMEVYRCKSLKTIPLTSVLPLN